MQVLNIFNSKMLPDVKNGVKQLARVSNSSCMILQNSHISVLDSQVWPLIARHFPDDSYVFHDDNAPVHRARIVERYKHDNNIYGAKATYL
jgi:hypothetical protein